MGGSPAQRFGAILAEPLRNGLTRPKSVRGVGVRMVNMGEVFGHDRIGDIPMDRVVLSDGERSRFLLSPGDLLFARQSLVLAGAGKCALFLGASEPVTFESHLIRARINRTVGDPAFWFYFFMSPQGRRAMSSIVEQVAAAGIRGSDLADLEVPSPSLGTQRAIACVLGALDDKIELNRKMNQTLEGIARAIFKSWFVGFDPVRAKAEGRDPGLPSEIADLFPSSFADSELGPIPEGWRAGSLGDIVAQRLQRVGQRDAVVLSAVATGQLTRSDEHFTKRVHSEDTARYLAVEQWDYAYNPSRANIGSIGMLDDPLLGAVSPVYVVFRPVASYRWFLHFNLKCEDTREWIRTLASGSVRQSLSFKDFASIPCVVPAQLVIAKFNGLWEALRRPMLAKSRETESLAALRDTLLPRLISGELRVPDAERIAGRCV